MTILLNLIASFLIADLAVAQTRNFQQCPSTATSRTELDHFCPRMEGIHLESCCPPLAKSPPLKCDYHVVVKRGQPYLAESSYTTCQNDTTVSVRCCTIRQRDCSRNPITLDFYPRLLNRNKTCCFENCPTADYWRSPPAVGDLSPEHELGKETAACTDTVLDECDAGNAANCQASVSCPPPPPQPAPASPSSPAPQPNPPSPPPPPPLNPEAT